MTAAPPAAASADEIYHAIIMDRARRPRHQRRLEAATVEAEARNPLCGDRVSVQLAIAADGRVAAIGYQARACAICIAASDLMAEMVPGMDSAATDQAVSAFAAALRSDQAFPAEGGIAALAPFAPLRDTPSRIQCALLGWQAVSAAFTTSSGRSSF